MKSAITLSILLAISPLNTFAEALGGAGPGGGNPSHVQEQTNRQSSRFADTMAAAEREERIRAARFIINSKTYDAQEKLEIYTSRVNLYLHIFELMKYPFSPEFKRVVNREKVIETFRNALEKDQEGWFNFSIDDSITLNQKPITFLSTPNLETPKSGKLVMNTKLFIAQEKTLKPWSIVATVFHEALRLQNIEASDSYPYTTEFALALKDAYENKNFVQLMNSAVFQGCKLPDMTYWYLAGHLSTRGFQMDMKPDWAVGMDEKIVRQPDAKFILEIAHQLDMCGTRVWGYHR